MKIIHKKKGFTLIELLLVIVIIGILAGVVIAVINPAEQNKRAREGVMRNHLATVCSAIVACQSANPTYKASNCDTAVELGIELPDEPEGATYSLSLSGDTKAEDYVRATANDAGGCMMRCLVYNDFRDWEGENAGSVRTISGCSVK